MEDATTFAFGLATPHAVLDTVEKRVLKTLGLDSALSAHALREFDTKAVGGEEPSRVHVATASLEHPLVLITILFDCHLCLKPQSVA